MRLDPNINTNIRRGQTIIRDSLRPAKTPSPSFYIKLWTTVYNQGSIKDIYTKFENMLGFYRVSMFQAAVFSAFTMNF